MGKVFLSRDAILAVDDLPVEEVWVPVWESWVRVQALNGKQAAEMSDLVEKNPQLVLAYYVIFGVVDENGAPLFTPADAEALNQKNAEAVRSIYAAVRNLSRMRSPAEIEENLAAAPGAGSGSG